MKTIRSFNRVLKEIFHLQKSFLIISFSIVCIQAIIPVMAAWAVKLIIDSLIVEANFNHTIRIVLIYLFTLSIFTILQNLLQKYFYQITEIKLKDKLKIKFCNKVKFIDNSSYEDPKYYDVMTRTITSGDKHYIAVSDTFFNFIGSLFIIAGLFSIVFVLNRYLLIIILFYVVFRLYLTTKINKYNYQDYVKSTKHNRYIDYLLRLFRLPTFINDIKLYSIDKIINEKYNDECKLRLDVKSKIYRKRNSYDILNSILELAFMGSIIIMLVYDIVFGRGTVGDFAALMNSTQQLGNSIVSFLLIIPRLKDHNMYITDIYNFLNYESKIEKEDGKFLSDIRIISFENVSFKYPKANEYTLKNISFNIEKGSKIAIVGHNGAGKSTLIKLILRMYDATEGTIKVNNENITNLNVQHYRSKFGVMFQNFDVYAMSVFENILLKKNIGSDTTDFQVFQDTLKKVDLDKKVSTLPNGENTILSKEFDENGVLLSGGEKQKIGIARMYALNKDFIILDEASSALDPYVEDNLYGIIFDSFKEKTVIIISHRLSITRKVDKIIILENGRIVEEGSHDELMRLNQKYSEMYKLQADKYLY